MSFLNTLMQRWQAASRREQRFVLLAMVLILCAMLWWIGVAPALKTLRAAQIQHQQLEVQLQEMQRLQLQAKSLQAQPRITPEDARRLLEASIKSMGSTAQLTQVGDRFTLTLKAASADALAQWLVQVRQSVRSMPAEARLVRNAAGAWDGTLVLSIK